MNAEAINQAMAEFEGWRLIHGQQWKDGYASTILPPNYTSDLNAVARVVGKMKDEDRTMYLINLNKITGHIVKSIDALAPQRCEAILRACGKWVEG